MAMMLAMAAMLPLAGAGIGGVGWVVGDAVARVGGVGLRHHQESECCEGDGRQKLRCRH
jgi:hypothetical protein